jgi:hypothetical protein
MSTMVVVAEPRAVRLRDKDVSEQWFLNAQSIHQVKASQRKGRGWPLQGTIGQLLFETVSMSDEAISDDLLDPLQHDLHLSVLSSLVCGVESVVS